MRTYINKKDTAALIRKALKEAFPDMKFSVVSGGSNTCSVLAIRWEDGANEAQVSAVINRFKGVSFDGMTDSTNTRYYLMDGKEVSFYYDYINYHRTNSDAAIQRAIDQVYHRYTNNFSVAKVEKPTVSQFKNGQLMATVLDGFSPFDDLQRLIQKAVSKNSDRLKVNHSATAAKIFMTHDGGSSQRLHDALQNFTSNILQ